MKFQLDIYTWPALQGVKPCIRTSSHESSQDAKMHLAKQAEPYAYAVLLKWESGTFIPCDWNGNMVPSSNWPQRIGMNGDHPAVIALRADWQNLIAEVRYLHAIAQEPMIDIASEVLQARHPNVMGYAERLAWDAAI